MNEKINYWTTKRIDQTQALYRMVYGQRSNGKTTGVLLKGIDEYLKTGKTIAYVRRWADDLKAAQNETLFDGILEFYGLLKKSGGRFNNIVHKSGKWYMAKIELNDDNEEVQTVEKKPFCTSFALTKAEHYKGNSYPTITTILFDEFMTSGYYLPDEYSRFLSIVSTITRLRDDCVVYMCANTVSRDCPYFHEFRISKQVKKMEQGDIIYIKPENKKTSIAVEWVENNLKKGKVANIYTDFDNSTSAMINTGKWELHNYPHLTEKVDINNICFTFLIIYNYETIQGDIYANDNSIFIYLHRKTSEIQSPYKDLIYTTEFVEKPNWSTNIYKAKNRIEQKIKNLFEIEKVFYQDNEVGDTVNSYLKWCINH